MKLTHRKYAEPEIAEILSEAKNLLSKFDINESGLLVQIVNHILHAVELLNTTKPLNTEMCMCADCTHATEFLNMAFVPGGPIAGRVAWLVAEHTRVVGELMKLEIENKKLRGEEIVG